MSYDQVTFIYGMWIFCSGKAVEVPGGGVAALRRTTGIDDLRRQNGKAACHYRIISKKRSSHVSSLISMNLLQISVTMLMTPW